MNAFDLLKTSKLIFWDFDGVIKDSANLKIDAYKELLQRFETKTKRITATKLQSLGHKSRFEIIPAAYKYLTNEILEERESKKLCDLYSNLVVDKVISSPFVPGIEDYLSKNHRWQKFILVTNTPKVEIDFILKELELNSFFQKVFGAPDEKANIVKEILIHYNMKFNNSVFVGDTLGDFHAAKSNKVPFIFRGNSNKGKNYHYVLNHFQEK